MNFKYPVSLNLKNKICLVVGGGKVAFRKAQTLLTAEAKVQILSPKVNPELRQLIEANDLLWIKDLYREQYLVDTFLVIAATNNRQINNEISNYCHKRSILVNVVDSKKESDFLVNSFFTRGDLLIAISTNGQSPLLSSKIKTDLKKIYGPEYQSFLEILAEARIYAQEQILNKEKRKKFLKRLLEEDLLLELIAKGEIKAAREMVKKCLSLYLE